MITAIAFVGQAATSNVTQVNPAGPRGPAGAPGQNGANGQNGQDGVSGAPGIIQSFVRPDGTEVSKQSLTLDDIGAAAVGHTPIMNANYQVVPTDVDVGFVTLNAPRTVTLCDVDTFPLGQDLVIGDESGFCSATNTITVVVGAGTSDTIPQQSDGTIVLAYPFASVRLRRGAANIWKIV